MIHRVASSERYSSGLIEIQRDWSLIDVLDANQVLDVYELEAQRSHDESMKKARSKGA